MDEGGGRRGESVLGRQKKEIGKVEGRAGIGDEGTNQTSDDGGVADDEEVFLASLEFEDDLVRTGEQKR